MCPGAKQCEGICGGAAGDCGVGGHGDGGVAEQREIGVDQFERANAWMVESFLPLGVSKLIVLAPSRSEICAASCEFSDEIAEFRIKGGCVRRKREGRRQ